MVWPRLLLASLIYHARLHLAVMGGVAVATAVLTGALLVGASMRGSLRDLTLDRLGWVTHLLLSDHFFQTSLASETRARLIEQGEVSPEVASSLRMEPAILLPGSTVELQGPKRARVTEVLAMGLKPDFPFFADGSSLSLDDEEIAINEPLATRLGARLGDKIALRFASAEPLPGDSPLAHKDRRVTSLVERTVARIVPAAQLGRFSLHPQQVQPCNAWVPLATLQEVLSQPDKANAMFVRGPTDEPFQHALSDAFQPKLEDYGLRLTPVALTWNHDGATQTVAEYVSLTSDRMLLEPEVVRVATTLFASQHPQPLFTYLANRIERIPLTPEDETEQRKRGPISYSTITAVDSTTALGPCLNEDGELLPPLDDQGIYVNSWAADDQGLAVGDRVRLTYFEPEATHGDAREQSAELIVRGIVPLTEPVNPFSRRRPAEFDARPTLANDPHLTPEVRGVTDQDSIAKWEAPFPVDYQLVRSQDDTYWEHHRTTPKAFVSLKTGTRLWGSRWGHVTSLRWVAPENRDLGQMAQQLAQQLHREQIPLGFAFQPIRTRDLAASSGTTPFDVLFLSLSFFLVIAALLLVVLLFRLAAAQRAGELGLLLGCGWSRRQATRHLLAEATCVATSGAVLGMALGTAYGWLLLVGLRTWWLGAIATPFLTLHVPPTTLLLGGLLGLLTSLVTLYLSLRGFESISIRQLLAGQLEPENNAQHVPANYARKLAWVSLPISLLLSVTAVQLRGEAQAGIFLLAGAGMLLAMIAATYAELRRGGLAIALSGSAALWRLAWRNAARHPLRSVLTLSLVAGAVFLIVSLSAFRLTPSQSASGGCSLLAKSSQPLLFDLNDPQRQAEFLASDAKLLSAAHVLPFRERSGDDASCRNLYQALQPRVLGVSERVVTHYDDPTVTPFSWSAHAGVTPEEQRNPWRLLASATPADKAVPVVLDQNTAMFSLKLYRGVGEEFTIRYANGPEVPFRVVGLLANSVLQGSLLIGDADFRRLFPAVSGHRQFLIQTPAEIDADHLAQVLADRFSDIGWEVRRTDSILSELLAVQNTYISAFQTLGALGLLLGTLGVAAVQLRSVWERKSELGLLRATGFSLARLTRLVLIENLTLLLGGLIPGCGAALLVVVPHIFFGDAHIPWSNLAAMLGLILLVGLIVSTATTRAVGRLPLLASLRGD